MGKIISCGIMVINEYDEILMCHPAENAKYDLPKGELDPEESYIECAIRETFEETGIKFTKDVLIELGLFEFIEKKDLYLYKTFVKKKDINLNELTCISYFEEPKTKQMVIEVVGYSWVKFKDLSSKVPESMYKVLNIILEVE